MSEKRIRLELILVYEQHFDSDGTLLTCPYYDSDVDGPGAVVMVTVGVGDHLG